MKPLTLVLLAALAACSAPDGPVRPFTPGLPQTSRSVDRASYIIQFDASFRGNPDAEARSLNARYGGQLHFIYTHALRGFAAELPDAAVNALESNPSVALVELDGVATADGTQLNPPSWGLDRVDQRDLPLDNSYTYPTTGAGVTAYIVDTGIWFDHREFGDGDFARGIWGRATWGATFVNEQDTDCNGHGTHVSGTVGGTHYGVAKEIALVSVKVLNCSGSGEWSGVIAGLDWIVAHAVRPAVVNMSIGGGYIQAVNDAVSGTVATGITVVVSAGNSNADACTQSPAATPEAITVAATDQQDRRASFSNVGSCVDLFAPGVAILSAWVPEVGSTCVNDCTNTISGTSMASPHVTGAAALYLSANPFAAPAQVRDALADAATVGRVSNPGSASPNQLLYVDWTSSPPPPPPPPPPPTDNASFTTGCGGLTCTFTAVSSGSWTFGDGGSASGATVQHTFSPRRDYMVTHTVGSESATRIVRCNPKQCRI